MNNEDKNIELIKRFRLTANVDDRTFHNGVEYVDLCLPSGLKWAAMNVGAKHIEDDGLYFQWGDTQGYTMGQIYNKDKSFEAASYKFVDNNAHAFIKYTTDDNKVKLDLEDDAAHVHLGGSWRMPTTEEAKELINHTFKEIKFVNGVIGTKFISAKDINKWIFIPYCGDARLNSIFHKYLRGYIWTSTAYCCNGFSDALGVDRIYTQNTYFSRYRGFQVRGVF